MRLLRQFQARLFFLWKYFERTITNQNQPTIQKQANKNNNGNHFLRIKKSERAKIGYFALWWFLYSQNLFAKKLDWLEIFLTASFTILLTCTPINHAIDNLFVRTYFYLWSSVRISSFYENLFYSLLSVRISFYWENLSGISIICVNLCLYENMQT